MTENRIGVIGPEVKTAEIVSRLYRCGGDQRQLHLGRIEEVDGKITITDFDLAKVIVQPMGPLPFVIYKTPKLPGLPIDDEVMVFKNWAFQRYQNQDVFDPQVRRQAILSGHAKLGTIKPCQQREKAVIPESENVIERVQAQLIGQPFFLPRKCGLWQVRPAKKTRWAKALNQLACLASNEEFIKKIKDLVFANYNFYIAFFPQEKLIGRLRAAEANAG